MKTKATFITVLLLAAALLASCATGKEEKQEAEPEVIQVQLIDTTGNMAPVKVLPAPGQDGGGTGEVTVEVRDAEMVIPVGEEPLTEQEAQHIAEEVSEFVEQTLETEKPAEPETQEIQTKIVETDAGEIILTTRGSNTSFLFPAGTEYQDMEGVVLKMMDVFPQTAFTFGSALNMQAPENFVLKNSDEIDFVLKTWFAKNEEQQEAQEAEAETVTEQTFAEGSAQTAENIHAPEPEAEPETAAEPETKGETVSEVVTNAAGKAKEVVGSAAAKTGLSSGTFMLLLGGGVLLVLVAVLIILIIRRKRDE